MPLPLIGITGRRRKTADLARTPETFRNFDGDWYYTDYAKGVLDAGGLPLHLPLDVPPELFIDRLDGVLLSGGADINPDRYGSAPEPTVEHVEDERDAFELELLEHAARTELPVLGICRGLQLVNVHAGGTLHQHDSEHVAGAYDAAPETLRHAVRFEPGSVLESLYGPELAVNSLHHQTVDHLGSALWISGSCDDIVEGLEHQHLPIVAVQWHPEMMATRSTDPVFGWLVAEAAARAMATRTPR